MRAVAPVAELERRLADARTFAPGTTVELAALVELASRLVRDPPLRGVLAREGVELAIRLGAATARLRCEAMVAEVTGRQDNPTDGLALALKTLAEAERVPDPQTLAQAHHAVAHCLDHLDCTAEALEHVQQGLEFYRQAGDPFGEGRLLSFMAALMWRMEDRDRARQLYERAYEVFLHCDDPTGAGVMLSCLADLQREAGESRAAQTCERALECFERAGMPLDAVNAMRAYAQVFAAAGEYDLAELWIKRAIEHNTTADGAIAIPSHYLKLTMTLSRLVLIPRGELAAARAILERTIILADELKAVRVTAEAEAALAEVLHADGDWRAAYQHLHRSQALTATVTQATYDTQIRALRVRFEVDQAERDAARYREQARAQAEAIAELERTRSELAERMAELEQLNAAMERLSQTDPLTGIANRRFMTDRLTELSQATARYGTALAAAVFDVDLFKSINDRFGHAGGDAVLVTLSRLTRQQMRTVDLIARLGGDEFAIIMPGTELVEAVAACERLTRAVRDYPWNTIAAGLAVSITIGVADGTGEADPDEILRLADAALYRGKRAGRDTVAS
jgi:diguanylate cyclase (GGDEF)-like protein